MESSPLCLPESMVRVELEGRLRNMGQQYGLGPEKIMEMMAALGKSPEDIQNEWRPATEKALHSRLIVETLIEQEKIDASEEEMEKELEIMAGESNTPLEDIKKYYQEDSARDYLKEDVKERKLFDILLAENTINQGKKEKYLDIMGNNG